VLVDRESIGSVEVKSGILLGGRNENNWYHWVIEYVSRLSFDKAIPPAVPILVSDSVPVGFLEVISSVSKRKIIQLPKTLDWRVESLFVAQPLAQILDSTVIPWAEGLFINSAALSTYREMVLESHIPYPSPSKIFLTRNSGHRGLINQESIRRAAESFGFTSVDTATMTWNQQLNLFRNAKTVVGASGAVMANYLFMPMGAKIVALTNKQIWDFILPAAIARVANVEFFYLLGKPKLRNKPKTSTALMHSDFEISKKEFISLLASITS
jgi:capsular polysaccharide biosynthesis protein